MRSYHLGSVGFMSNLVSREVLNCFGHDIPQPRTVMSQDDEPSNSGRVTFGSRLPQSQSSPRWSQHRNMSKASPLVSFSKSLQDARKNADALVVSAQNNEHVKKFKNNLEDFEQKLKLQAQEASAKLNSMASHPGNSLVAQDWHMPSKPPGRPSGMRKSYSATDFNKLSLLFKGDEAKV